jgi:hypothetical protein
MFLFLKTRNNKNCKLLLFVLSYDVKTNARLLEGMYEYGPISFCITYLPTSLVHLEFAQNMLFHGFMFFAHVCLKYIR